MTTSPDTLLMDIGDTLYRLADAERFGKSPSIVQRLVEELGRGGLRNAGMCEVRSAGGIRALTTTSDVDASVLSVSQPRMTQPQRRRLFLRDVVPVVPIGTMATPFVRELSPQSTELAASGVAEGATKPDVTSALNFVGDLVTPGVLAVNITVTEQLWSDAPAFVSYVEGQLPYWTRVREEFACFQGNGEVVNAGITGLLNDSNVTSAPFGGLMDALLAGYGDLGSVGVEPDVAFVNPVDWASTLGAAYNTASGSGNSIQVLDHVPFRVVPTVSMPAGHTVIGDFAGGGVLVEREDVNLAVYQQHSDYRARGLALVQGEERIGWHVTAPWRFRVYTGSWS